MSWGSFWGTPDSGLPQRTWTALRLQDTELQKHKITYMSVNVSLMCHNVCELKTTKKKRIIIIITRT